MALTPAKTTLAQRPDPIQCANIYVNGKTYFIETSLLEEHPNSKLAKLYKGLQNNITYGIGIDRDDKWFEVILSFMRNSSLKPLNYTAEELEELLEEATYYELPKIKQKFEAEILKRKKYRKIEVQDKSYVFFDLVKALEYIKTTNRKAIVVDISIIHIVKDMSNFYKLCYPVATYFSILPGSERLAFYDEKGQVLFSTTGSCEASINKFFLNLKANYINLLL